MIVDILSRIPTDELDLELSAEFPFPEYEMEIVWAEWRWNGARTERLTETIIEGVSINPVDYLDENGRVIESQLADDCVDKLISIITNEDRVGNIIVRA